MQKIGTYFLDAATLWALYLGVVTSQDLLTIIGIIAAMAAIVNHSQQIYERHKKK